MLFPFVCILQAVQAGLKSNSFPCGIELAVVAEGPEGERYRFGVQDSGCLKLCSLGRLELWWVMTLCVPSQRLLHIKHAEEFLWCLVASRE